eukprot:TRINITY_DN17572_c0_g2_i1.p1 TRINITY_DN17572_c0_g2~~TRINITY_DN17572_c0_g2_i1.p1  ORF type:complete len:392 (-),score=83.98 TRINITY_DN17572_c0_g2_i1:163-1248(-)
MGASTWEQTQEMAVALRAYAARTRTSAMGLATKASKPSVPAVPAAASKPAGPAAAAASPKGSGLIDIGANMLDPMFRGEYREKQRHASDLPAVMLRARSAGVERLMVTAGSLTETREAMDFCAAPEEGWPALFFTVGVHPTRCGEFDAHPAGADAYMSELVEAGKAAAPSGRCAAVGECGLDYDRLEFCDRQTQLRYFKLQLERLAVPLRLPLFLHCRTSEAAKDLAEVLEAYKGSLASPPGVVHSFDGSLEDAERLMALGFYIGLNGCSLRTLENLEVVRQLPADRILLETDAPWCGIKATHPSHAHVKTTWADVKKPEKWEEGKCVKDRNEPCHLRQVGFCFAQEVEDRCWKRLRAFEA